MRRPTYTATPGLLGKLSGLPRATIVNWLEGRVTKPRHWQDLMAVADALRLSDLEIDALLEAAEYPPLSTLRPTATESAAASIPHRSSPLPAQLTELVGRGVALTDIRERLTAVGTRLVTLVGTGGVGKTHLAIAAAEGLQHTFADGIVWVPLAAVDDAAQVMPHVLQALGIREPSGTPTIESIAGALRTKRVLLVLDNFEQVSDAAGDLGDLLRNTINMKALVTSRVALHVGGESEFRVVPLALPDLRALPELETLRTYDAISLFVKRSAAYGSDFVLTKRNAHTVAAICARVDGLPLALELAAARTILLSPEDLLRRLDSRLSLLTNGTRDTNVRQRTLRNTIAWSYALLSLNEQQLLRRLAVFGGGISFAAAGAVAEVDVRDRLSESNNLFEALSSLVDQSLLTASPSVGLEEPRFAMLETIREYALELLTEHGEAAATKLLHARYFLRFCEDADARFSVEPTIAWVRYVQSEYDNIRSALLYFLEEAGDAHSASRVVAALSRYWFERGLFGEARTWLERVRGAAQATEPGTAAKILLYVAFVANYESDYMAGSAAAQEALDAYEVVGDRAGAAQSRNALGIAAMYTGRYDLAEHLFGATLRVYRELGDERGVAVALHNLGEIASECRFDFVTAEQRYEESLAIFRQLGHTMNVGSTLGVLAELRAHRGDIAGARTLGLEALATYRQLDNQPLIAEELTRLGRLELSTGNVREAGSLLAGAVDHLRMSFHARLVARCFEALASLNVAKEAHDRAARMLGFTQQLRDTYNLPRLPAWEREYASIERAVIGGLTIEKYGAEFALGRSFSMVDAFVETEAV